MQTIKRILLVEDNIDDQFFFLNALASAHPTMKYEVAANGLEALKLMAGLPKFEMIFLDLYMPKMDGFEFLENINDNLVYKNVPIVIISALDHPKDIERCRKLGVVHFFSKPVTFYSLFSKLNLIQFKNLLPT